MTDQKKKVSKRNDRLKKQTKKKTKVSKRNDRL